jgi:hypothetical protein
VEPKSRYIYGFEKIPIRINTSLRVYSTYGAFTLDVKSMLNENLGGILGGTQS